MKKINTGLLETMVQNLLFRKASSSQHLRQAIYGKVKAIVGSNQSSKLNDEVLESYTEKIARYAYKTTDRDIQELQDAGYSQGQIFELSVTAALSAGKTRIDIVQELLKP
ncbi:MAG: hypothetical protein AAFP82_11145 [Bacteroidota bacterium]